MHNPGKEWDTPANEAASRRGTPRGGGNMRAVF
jgi:hypothetical protein